MKRRFLGIVLIVCALAALFTFSASAAGGVDSGTLNEALSWSLDSNGVLTISGNGYMPYYHEWGEVSPFESNENIRAVVLEPGVKSVGQCAFYDCSGIQEITIPDSVTMIGNEAFRNCSSLKNVSIPKNVTSVGSGAFVGCTGITAYMISPENTSYCAVDGVLFSADKTKLISYPGGKNGPYVVPDGVQSIDSYAFQNCAGLTSLSLSGSENGWDVSGCMNLSEIVIRNDNGEYSARDGVLFSADGTTLMLCPEGKSGTYTIPAGVTEIKARAFSDCSKLTAVKIPTGIARLPYRTFEGCTSLKSVQLPEGLTYIGEYTFENCANLQTVDLPDTLEELDMYAFMNWTGLKTITIPDRVEIGPWALRYCPNLETIYLGITTDPYMDGFEFVGDDSLMNIFVSEEDPNFSSVDGVLFTKNLSTLVYLPNARSSYIVPDGTITAKYRSFYASEMDQLTLCEGMEGISMVGLSVYSSSFYIPQGLKYSGYVNDLPGFPNLTDIYYGGSEAQWKEDVEFPKAVTVHYNHTHTWSSSGAISTCTECGAQKVGAEPILTGWQKIDGKWYYYNQDGTMRTSSWLRSNSKWYYLNADGSMRTGWLKSGSKWYYMDQNGAMVTGWKEINGKKYYMNASGAMQTGWVKVSEKWYYMDASGAMQTGWVKVSEKWYYMDRATGQMRRGWIKSDGNWYYLNDSGAMVKGWQQIKDKWYFFNGSGVMLTGTQVINGKTQLFDDNGVWLGRLDN